MVKNRKRWIRRYLAAGKPAIGLCLGGQLIANALEPPLVETVIKNWDGRQYKGYRIYLKKAFYYQKNKCNAVA